MHNSQYIIYTGAAVNIPVPVFVGTSVGLIIILVLLVAVMMVGVCAYIKWWKKKRLTTSDNDYDYVMERGSEVRGAGDPVEMKVNEAYATLGQEERPANDAPRLESFDEGVYYEELK